MDRAGTLATVAYHNQSRISLLQYSREDLSTIDRAFHGPGAVKRPIDCVEILARVLKQTDARLVMVGDGSERTNAIHRAKVLGVYDKCVFVGKQPNIVDYLCASDLLLLPSEQESFGLAALEAMAVQVPVIASRVGGVPEVVDDGETGFLSAVGDVDKMADDAVKLLTNPELRREMGKRARESAITRYRTDIVIPQYIEFYNRVLAKKGI